MFKVVGTVTNEENGWRCSVQVPIFYLEKESNHPDYLSMLWEIGRRIVDPFNKAVAVTLSLYSESDTLYYTKTWDIDREE